MFILSCLMWSHCDAFQCIHFIHSSPPVFKYLGLRIWVFFLSRLNLKVICKQRNTQLVKGGQICCDHMSCGWWRGGRVYILYMCIACFDCITSVQTFVDVKDSHQKPFCYISTEQMLKSGLWQSKCSTLVTFFDLSISACMVSHQCGRAVQRALDLSVSGQAQGESKPTVIHQKRLDQSCWSVQVKPTWSFPLTSVQILSPEGIACQS